MFANLKIDNNFLFLKIENKKSFKKYLFIVFNYFLELFKKIIIKIQRIIKNKTLHVKLIFKT